MIRTVLVANGEMDFNQVTKFVLSYGLKVIHYGREAAEVPGADLAIIHTEKVSHSLGDKVRAAFSGRPLLMTRGTMAATREEFEKLCFGDKLRVLRSDASCPSTVKLAWVLARTNDRGVTFNTKVFRELVEHYLNTDVPHYTFSNFLTRARDTGDIKAGSFRSQYKFVGLSEDFVAGLVRHNLWEPAFASLVMKPGEAKVETAEIVTDVVEPVVEPAAIVAEPTAVPAPAPKADPQVTISESLFFSYMEKIDAKLERIENFEAHIGDLVAKHDVLTKLGPKVALLDTEQLHKLNALVDALFTFNREPARDERLKLAGVIGLAGVQ